MAMPCCLLSRPSLAHRQSAPLAWPHLRPPPPPGRAGAPRSASPAPQAPSVVGHTPRLHRPELGATGHGGVDDDRQRWTAAAGLTTKTSAAAAVVEMSTTTTKLLFLDGGVEGNWVGVVDVGGGGGGVSLLAP